MDIKRIVTKLKKVHQMLFLVHILIIEIPGLGHYICTLMSLEDLISIYDILFSVLESLSMLSFTLCFINNY